MIIDKVFSDEILKRYTLAHK